MMLKKNILLSWKNLEALHLMNHQLSKLRTLNLIQLKVVNA